jgi:1,4-alpha-glucan branching enzyme
LLSYPLHAGLQQWVRDLNRAYADVAALWQVDYEPSGFSWIDCRDHDNSVISFLRFAQDPADAVVVVVNFTPLPREQYRIGVPRGGAWLERLNSDAAAYGGSNMGNGGRLSALGRPSHGHGHSLSLTLPPLGFLLLQPE